MQTKETKPEVKEEKTPLEQLVDELPAPGAPLEGEDEGTTPPAPSAEKKDEKVTPPSGEENPDEDNIPFHKHPRFKNLIKENKELRATLAEINQKLTAQPTAEGDQGKEAEVPNWFKSIYGDSQELWKEFSAHSATQQQEIVAKAVEMLREEITRPQREAEQVQTWIKDKIAELHDDGEEFEDDDLINVMKEYTPFGDNGQLDFRKGLKLMKAFATVKSKESTEKEKSDARKKIGAMTAGGGQGAPAKSAVNMNDIRKKSFNQLAREG